MATIRKKPDEERIERNSPAMSPLPQGRGGVTARAFLLGMLTALTLCAVTPYNDQYVAATYIAGNFFPIGAFGAVLFIVLLLNPLLIRFASPKRAFSPAEIITVWAMITVVSGIPSSGLMRYLIPHIIAPHYYATPVNGWENTIIPHIPSYLLVSDKQAIRGFFEGLRPGETIPWHAWLGPLAWWGLFVACFIGSFFCLSAILRRQWVDRERLSFPLVQVPLMIAERPEPGHLFNRFTGSKLLWLGVGVVTAVHTIKGLHQFFPTIPDIQLSLNTGQFLTTPPLNQLGTQMAIYPLVIGFAFIVPSEVAFSLWFFYIAFKLQAMGGYMLGIDNSPPGQGISMGPAYVAYQEAGGAIALVVWLLWSMRGQLGDVWRKAVHGARDVDDSAEPLPYRGAFFGLIASVGGMFLWLTSVAHVQAAVAAVVVGGALVVFVLVSWLVAQAGLLFCQVAFSPAQLFTVLNGTTHINPGSLSLAAITEHVGWYDARELMMPSIINANKGATESGLNARRLTGALAACVACALVVSAAAFIMLPYTHGGGGCMNQWTFNMSTQVPFTWTTSLIASPKSWQPGVLYNMTGGALLVIALFLCRSAFTWFCIHPAGFLVAGTYPMYTIWFSVFLGWLLKVPLMRYGGIATYRKALPLMVGLIVGDCLNALLWVVVGLVTHTGYMLLPT